MERHRRVSNILDCFIGKVMLARESILEQKESQIDKTYLSFNFKSFCYSWNELWKTVTTFVFGLRNSVDTCFAEITKGS